MKKWILISACLAIFTMFSGCEEEDEEPWRTSISTITSDGKFVSDVDIYFYKTEVDYVLNKNVVFQGKTDTNGKFRYESKSKESYYFRAKKGDLNNYRNSCIYSGTTKGCSSSAGVGGKSASFSILLTRTPVKLQLNVFESGVPVSGAEVQLYLGEEDYNKDITYWRDIYDVSVVRMKMNGTTDADGSILFPDLEPRQYWFKIKKGNKNNSTTIFKTPNVLEDNPDITNSFDVGIK